MLDTDLDSTFRIIQSAAFLYIKSNRAILISIVISCALYQRVAIWIIRSGHDVLTSVWSTVPQSLCNGIICPKRFIGLSDLIISNGVLVASAFPAAQQRLILHPIVSSLSYCQLFQQASLTHMKKLHGGLHSQRHFFSCRVDWYFLFDSSEFKRYHCLFWIILVRISRQDKQ